MSVFQALASWAYGHFKSFVVIVLILAAGMLFRSELTAFQRNTRELAQLPERVNLLSSFLAAKRDDASRRVEAIERSATGAIEARVRALDAEVERRRVAGRRLRTLDLLTGNVAVIQQSIELEVLLKERDYLASILTIRTQTEKLISGKDELERLRLSHVAAFEALKNNQRSQALLLTSHPYAARMPGTDIWKQLRTLRNDHVQLDAKNRKASEAYQTQRKMLEAIRIPERPVFSETIDEVETALAPLKKRLALLEEEQRKSWIGKLSQPVSQAIPAALMVLLPIVFAPLLIKAFLYYVVAPVAGRRPAVTLLPEVSGALQGGPDAQPGQDHNGAVSAVSQAVILERGEELLIHAEYLQSSATGGVKDTKWLLDWRYPFTSVASGMLALTRVRASGTERYTISATRDPLDEVGLIRVPEGSAIVLQPHNLVGLVQQVGRPTMITRHWRLASLNAWLTLQLRYLAFHGPTTLIAKGCRGIRIEQADGGRSINQAATIGFSGNLAYATLRCETFSSYLMGKQELFNDNFSGGPGHFIYEEMPHAGKRGGFYGRGLEGLFDSVLKVFGV